MVNANQMFATETRAPRANRKGREGKRPIETAVDERTQTKGGIVWQDTDFAKISRTCDTTAPNPGCLFRLLVDIFTSGETRQRHYYHLPPLTVIIQRIWQIVWRDLRLGFVAEKGTDASIAVLGAIFVLPCPGSLLYSNCFLLLFTHMIVMAFFFAACCSVRAAGMSCLSCIKRNDSILRYVARVVDSLFRSTPRQHMKRVEHVSITTGNK